MAARVTVERVLRDEDDASGQSIRKWTIEAEPGGAITIRSDTKGFLLIRSDDVDIFVQDLNLARESADELAKET